MLYASKFSLICVIMYNPDDNFRTVVGENPRLSKLKMLGANLDFLGANRVPLDNLEIRTVYCYLGLWSVKIRTMSAGKVLIKPESSDQYGHLASVPNGKYIPYQFLVYYGLFFLTSFGSFHMLTLSSYV